MSLSRVKTWVAGEVLTASDLNSEFNNIVSNPTSLISPLTGALDLDGYTLTVDSAGVTKLNSTAAISLDVTSGAKSGTPGVSSGSVLAFSAQTFTDSNTSASSTATQHGFVTIAQPTLAATNASVTTTDAATLYIPGAPTAGTNETITNAWALWIDSGAVRLDGDVQAKSTMTVAGALTANGTIVAGSSVVDAGGNEYFNFSSTASAVNEITVTNAATGSAPSLSATGGDTNVDVELTPKGTGKVTENGGAIMPTGAVVPYAGSSAPTGWLLCDGTAVSRTTYANLFAVISTTYGVGDGSTTFNVPDITGRAIFGKESTATRLTSGVSGVDGGTLGATGGEQNAHHATITVTDPGHTHSYSSHRSYVAASTSAGSDIPNSTLQSQTSGSAMTGITAADGNTGTSENMPPAIVLNYIIKT